MRGLLFAPLGLVLLLTGLLFFSRLRAPLLEPQEARYASIPREMLAESSLLVPVHEGSPYLDKPPLFYWCIAAAFELFGALDRVARLVPALAGALTVVVAYLFGRRAIGPGPAFVGALILCLSPGFVYRGRMLTFDSLLMLWTTLALAAAARALEGPRLSRPWWLLSAVACGFGLLTKGPVALALVLPPIVLAAWFERRLARPSLVALAIFLGTAVAIAAPWYALVIGRHPEFADYFFLKHNVERYVAPFDHAGPIWYYVPHLLFGLGPWAILLPGFLRDLRHPPPRRPAGLMLPLLAFGWAFLFFSLAGCKRPTYLLPALPPLALVLGYHLHRLSPNLLAPAPQAALCAAVALLAVAGCALASGFLAFIAPFTAAVFVAAASICLLGVALSYRRVSFAAAFAATFACLFAAVFVLLPAYNDQFSLRGQLRRSVTASDRIVCYPQRWQSVAFYLPNARPEVFGYAQIAELVAFLRQHPNALLVVKTGKAFRDLERELPAEMILRVERPGVAVAIARAGNRHPTAREGPVRVSDPAVE